MSLSILLDFEGRIALLRVSGPITVPEIIESGNTFNVATTRGVAEV
jgi:hypothetical protein